VVKRLIGLEWKALKEGFGIIGGLNGTFPELVKLSFKNFKFSKRALELKVVNWEELELVGIFGGNWGGQILTGEGLGEEFGWAIKAFP